MGEIEIHLNNLFIREIVRDFDKVKITISVDESEKINNYYIVSKDKKKPFGDARDIATLITETVNNLPLITSRVKMLEGIIANLQYTVNCQQYPIFVYGTLRKGFHNYRTYLNNRTYKEIPATTRGKMYSLGSFPAVVEGDKTIYGELMYIKPEEYINVLHDLDFLEGFYVVEDSMYVRKLVDCFDMKGRKIKAWIYLWNRNIENFSEIISGDWKKC